MCAYISLNGIKNHIVLNGYKIHSNVYKYKQNIYDN